MDHRTHTSKAKQRHKAALKHDALQSRTAVDSKTRLASCYVYEKITTSQGFRLFTLRPGLSGEDVCGTLADHNLGARSSYVALSYMWGSLDSSTTIQIDGSIFQVRRNLFDALHALRRADQELTLWVDAICINQHDIGERNQQVALMWKIFSGARAVILWLGIPSIDKQVVFDTQRMKFKIDGDQSIDMEVYRDITIQSLPFLEELYQQLVSHPYWQRAWIKQEILAARYIVVCFGEFKIDWNSFAVASVKCRSYRLSLGNSPDHLLSTFTYHGVSRDLWSLIEQRRTGHRGETMRSLIEKYGMSACTDPRDRVFALFGLANNSVGRESMTGLDRVAEHRRKYWRPDYSLSKSEVYEMLAWCSWIRRGNSKFDKSFDQHLRRCLEIPKSYQLKGSPILVTAARRRGTLTTQKSPRISHDIRKTQ